MYLINPPRTTVEVVRVVRLDLLMRMVSEVDDFEVDDVEVDDVEVDFRGHSHDTA